ncbi:MAG: hypothetical protein M1298_05930 [Chloroflexi bacterium]|nr:hypothetical protein [Chloroflexota bacterium]
MTQNTLALGSVLTSNVFPQDTRWWSRAHGANAPRDLTISFYGQDTSLGGFRNIYTVAWTRPPNPIPTDTNLTLCYLQPIPSSFLRLNKFNYELPKSFDFSSNEFMALCDLFVQVLQNTPAADQVSTANQPEAVSNAPEWMLEFARLATLPDVPRDNVQFADSGEETEEEYKGTYGDAEAVTLSELTGLDPAIFRR